MTSANACPDWTRLPMDDEDRAALAQERIKGAIETESVADLVASLEVAGMFKAAGQVSTIIDDLAAEILRLGPQETQADRLAARVAHYRSAA